MKQPQFNIHIETLDAPPIPRINKATQSYCGDKGPLIDLSQAVPGYPPPELMLQALGAAASDSTYLGYGSIEGESVLRSAYANDLEYTHGSAVPAEQIMITSGCNQAFVTAALTVASPGQSILLISPWYFNHESTLRMFGIRTEHVAVNATNGFLPTTDALKAALTPDIRAIVIVTPNNPTGAIYPPALIHQIAELCTSQGIWLILDETYQDFLPEDSGPAHDLFSDTSKDHLIVVSSFSKSYCIPGHRLGVVVTSEPAIKQMTKVMDNLQICAPRAPQVALANCMTELREWREDNRIEINQRAVALEIAIKELPSWSIEAIGAYFAYVRHPWSDRASIDVAENLASEYGVVTLPGEFFGPSQQQFLRVAFANVESDVIASLPQRLQGYQ